jgi:hypothetical protein
MDSMCIGKQHILFVCLLGMLLMTGQLYAQESPNSSQITWEEKKYSWYENNQTSTDFKSKSADKKSVSKAFFYSLLLPGLGEAYVGRYGYTRVFLSLEIIGWSLFTANRINVASREQDNRNFAVQHAGINRQGKDDQYWIDIGKYNDIYLFNEQRRRERDINALYQEDAINYWRWDSYANRLNYDQQRIEAREIERQEVFIVGAIVLNHLVSAINALRLAKAYNRNIDQLSWYFNFDYSPAKQELYFTLSKTF